MSGGIWLFTLCLAGWTSGQYMFSGKTNYQSMTNFFEPRHRGTLYLPPCIKDLLNCWEVMNPDVVCKNYTEGRNRHIVRLDTICMDLRFQCREPTGYAPFPENTNRTTNLFNYCPETKKVPVNPKYYVIKGLPVITTTAEEEDSSN
ncbi:uncharacterized protein LOC133523254 [Cydia pomonella]|uniref:uncharacterized protein LOC133523254 n=1 Tax=Cydia pomonella TaxID=82600 RepID=UPI002ADD70B0|nr:uncharacterized protein LOC133523254 [Cydia pomonella]